MILKLKWINASWSSYRHVGHGETELLRLGIRTDYHTGATGSERNPIRSINT